MSNPSDTRFDSLHASITQSMLNGVVVEATIGDVTGLAICSEVEDDSVIVMGGTAEGGVYDIQMKVSDFSTVPTKGTAITCNGPANGKELAVHQVKNHGAVYMIRAVDFASLDT